MMYLKLILLSGFAVIWTTFLSTSVSDWQCTGFLHSTNQTDHHRSRPWVRNIIDSLQSLSIAMNTDQPNGFSYSPNFLRSLSRPDDQVCKLSSETCKTLASLRLLRFPCYQHPTYFCRRFLRNKRWRRRGRRGGIRHVKRENQIPVVIVGSHSQHHEHCTYSRQNGRNLNNLKTLPRVKPHSNLCVHSWNAQSIGNKTVILTDHILEYDVDIMFINETWLAENDSVKIGECTPPGYEFINMN